MIDTLLLTLQKIFMLGVFIMTGYFLRRKKLLPEGSIKTLSYLGTNVICPAYSIKYLSTSFTRENLSENLPFFVWGLVFLAGTLLIGFIGSACFKNSKIERNTLKYIFAFPNYAYFGYPVIEGVFGADVLAKTIIFSIPCGIAINSIGYYFLMGEGKKIKDVILSPNVIGIVIGIIFGLSGLEIPFTYDKVTIVTAMLGFIGDSISTAGTCMSTITMLLTGIVLGKFPLKELFKSPLAYLISFVRLVIISVICALLLYVLNVRGLLFVIPVAFCAMPIGMNTILFTEAGGHDSSENARICFVSNIMSLFTIPVIFAIISNFM